MPNELVGAADCADFFSCLFKPAPRRGSSAQTPLIWRMTERLERRITRCDRRVNPAANVEITDDNDLSWPACLDEITEDPVDDVFVKCAFVAIRPEIEL